MIERIDNDIFNLNADKIDIDGTYDKEITLELSPSAVWQSLENIFPEGKDCTIHIDNPNKQTIFLACRYNNIINNPDYSFQDWMKHIDNEDSEHRAVCTFVSNAPIDEVYFYIDPKYCETILTKKVLKVK